MEAHGVRAHGGSGMAAHWAVVFTASCAAATGTRHNWLCAQLTMLLASIAPA